LIRGGNQVGKSFSCAFEASLHMTGQYPKWWKGRRFTKPTRGWIVGVTAQLVRDGPQRQLTNKLGECGTGTIPLASFAGKPVMVPGGTGAIDTMSVAHETGGAKDGVSTATYKSFEQGAAKMQSESVDWIWVDERCSEEVCSELYARTTATDGIIFLSYRGWRRADVSGPERVFARSVRHQDRGGPGTAHQPRAPGADGGELPAARARGAHPRHSPAWHCPRVSVPPRKPDAEF
jgi:phage terminase large subunit-like protein